MDIVKITSILNLVTFLQKKKKWDPLYVIGKTLENGKKKKIKPLLTKDKGKAFPQKVGHSFFNENSWLWKMASSCNINFTPHILQQDIWLKHPKGKKILIAPRSQRIC